MAAVRRFNRFYTARIGVLREGHLRSPFSLTEVRVLYELAHRQLPTATEIAKPLGLDPGYLSRILRSFRQRSLVRATPCQRDARQARLVLTPRGRSTYAALDARSNEEISSLLRDIPATDHDRLIDSMRVIHRVLDANATESGDAKTPLVLRAHEPGDMGWVVARHGALYWQEQKWDARFEAMVARIAADFIDHFDPKRERCWIAERDARRVGSVFVVRHSDTIAKLRLLLVEPEARGIGLGRRLVEECIRFARRANYRILRLWTQRSLGAARRIYERTGFRLVDSTPHQRWGTPLVGETWELVLSA